MRYKLSKYEAFVEETNVTIKLAESGEYIPLNKIVPQYILNALPRCDEKGMVPIIYYKKQNSVLFVSYMRMGCSINKGRSICASNRDIDDYGTLKDLVDEIRSLFGLKPKFSKKNLDVS